MTGYNLCFADIEIMCARLYLVGPGWTYPDYGTKKRHNKLYETLKRIFYQIINFILSKKTFPRFVEINYMNVCLLYFCCSMKNKSTIWPS